MRSLLTCLAAALAGLLAMPAAAQPYAYVPNYGSNDVSVVNTATNAVTATIALPGANGPYAVAANAAGTRVYFGNYFQNTISVIDTASNTAAAPVPVPLDYFAGLAVNPAGTRGYAVGNGSGNVVVLDLTTTPVSVITTIGGFSSPFNAVVSPDGSRVYVTNTTAQNVAVINTATNAVSFIATPSRNPYGIALDATGSNLWIAHDSGATRISDPAGTPVVGTGIATGSGAYGIAINAAGTTAYVTNYLSNTVSAINTATQAVTGSVGTSTPYGVSVTPDGSRVLVANQGSNSVSVFNASLALQATVGVGSNPFAFGIFIAQPAAPTTADITGTITNSLGGGAMSGVTVANSGAPSTSSNGSGVYSFADLANGSYTITPSVYNYIFSPLSRTVNLAGTDATGQNFVGTYNGIPDITDLRALVVAANLTDTRVKNSLLAPLDAALVWLNGSSPNRVAYSCSNLAKFIAATRQNISVGKLPAATGNPWIAAANDVLALSGCPTR